MLLSLDTPSPLVPSEDCSKQNRAFPWNDHLSPTERFRTREEHANLLINPYAFRYYYQLVKYGSSFFEYDLPICGVFIYDV